MENITLAPRKLNNLSAAAAETKALELLEQVGLSDKRQQYPAAIVDPSACARGFTMNGYQLDWWAVLSGQPREWLFSGIWMTFRLTVFSSLLATVIAVILLAMRLTTSRLSPKH